MCVEAQASLWTSSNCSVDDIVNVIKSDIDRFYKLFSQIPVFQGGVFALCLGMFNLLKWKYGTTFFDQNETLNVHEPPHDKTNIVSVRPAKTQISLDIRPVWSRVCAVRSVGS